MLDRIRTFSLPGERNGKQWTPSARMRTAIQRAIIAFALLAMFSAGVGADRLGVFGGTQADASSSLTDQPEFQALQQTWNLIHDSYVDQSAVVDSKLLYGAAKGMVDSLGDTGHSTFLSPDEAVAFRQATTGELIGIGIEIDFSTDEPRVVAPIDGSPAAAAGVKSRDIVRSVDGKSTAGMTPSDLFNALRGEEGTPVDVTFERPSTGETYTVHLVRQKIKIAPVSWIMLPGDVALIRLSEFSNGATDGVKQALQDAKAKGATSVILDLRNNPGGLVFEAIGVASQFLPEGTPIYQFQERDQEPRTIKTTGIGEGTDLPLVVIIDGGTASSAEIVASALQDSGRAKLVGETTFGTGTVLTPTTLDDGSIVLLGTGLWLTPKGKQIWHVGIAPDTEIELPTTIDAYRPEPGTIANDADLTATGDTQLLAAYDQIVAAVGSR